MGILRVYLALCVVATHSTPIFPWLIHDGRQAVQIFYIISGFYMAMVLSSRYATPKDFYLSRLMRIFPSYWMALIGTVAASVLGGLIFGNWLLLDPYLTHPLERNGIGGILFAAASNITIIGQDWTIFLKDERGHHLFFTTNFLDTVNPLWHYLLVPQCWSVGLELTFYAFAPQLNRLRSGWLVVIASGALAARLFCYWHFGLAHDPWDYRFFPFEISLFIFGMLGYRLYAGTGALHPSQRFRFVSRGSYIIGCVAILFLLCIQAHAVSYASRFVGAEIAPLLFYPFFALVLPVLFFAYGKQADDRIIGELSYPIYLVHLTVIYIASPLLNHFAAGRALGVVSAAITVIVAAAFYKWLIAPIDKARHLLAHAKANTLPEAAGVQT